MSQQEPQKPFRLPVDIRLLVSMAGILLAPFIGFLLDPNFGLGILVVCLGVVAWMTWGISQQAPPPQARTLRIGAILNGVMAVAAVLLLLIRL